eukprot:6418337-Amphidinium_carterae.1
MRLGSKEPACEQLDICCDSTSYYKNEQLGEPSFDVVKRLKAVMVVGLVFIGDIGNLGLTSYNIW